MQSFGDESFWGAEKELHGNINVELGRRTLLLSWDIGVCLSGS